MAKRDAAKTGKSSRPAGAKPTGGEGGLLPSVTGILDPRGPFLIPLVLLVASRVIAWGFLPVSSEDAYITYRFARNLAAGSGLVYNPGEAVMGFTSPLWTLWHALGALTLKDLALWSRWTTLLSDVATLLVAGMLLLRHASRTAAWIFNYFWATWPYFAAMSASGMENSTMFCLIVLGAALSERRSVMAGPTLGALALIRPEGIVAAAVLGLSARWRDRLIALGAASAGWGALAIYYGNLIPQSVAAKAYIYGTPGPWVGRHWWEWLSPVAFGRWPVTGEGSTLVPLTVLLAPAFVVGVFALWGQRKSGLASTVAAALSVWLGYAVLGVVYFYWYFIVPLGGVMLAVAVGLPRLVRGRAILVSCALLTVGTWSVVRALYIGRMQNEVNAFYTAAEYLSAQARPGEKVMLEPIGIIGYTTPLVVIDEVGLVSPQVAARRLRGAGWYTDIAMADRPDWLVIRSSVLRQEGAFAGAGAPFRSAAERDSLFARYQRVYVADPGRVDLEIHHRVR